MGWVDLENIALGKTPEPKWTLELNAKWDWKPPNKVLTQKVLWFRGRTDRALSSLCVVNPRLTAL